jgi:hypothetical protein
VSSRESSSRTVLGAFALHIACRADRFWKAASDRRFLERHYRVENVEKAASIGRTPKCFRVTPGQLNELRLGDDSCVAAAVPNLDGTAVIEHV